MLTHRRSSPLQWPTVLLGLVLVAKSGAQGQFNGIMNTTDLLPTTSDGNANNSSQDVVVMSCTLCPDSTHVPNDPNARFDSGITSMTCAEAYSEVWELERDSCILLQSWGQGLCQCGMPQDSSRDRCNLCADGRSLPNGRKQGFSGTTCAQLQVRAIRDADSMCPVWQQTVGEYCDCLSYNNSTSSDNATTTTDPTSSTTTGSSTSSMCRLCGAENRLPDHLRLIVESDKSCGELEFLANRYRESDDREYYCSEYQRQYSTPCCCVEQKPIPHNTSSAKSFFRGNTAAIRVSLQCAVLVVLSALLLL